MIREEPELITKIKESTQLAKHGRQWTGICPFCKKDNPETKTVNFQVLPDKGFYHCFKCGAHGYLATWPNKTSEKQGVWNKELVCNLSMVVFHSDSSILLKFPTGHCCDMAGAIKFSKRLLPGVTFIRTLSGPVKDVDYHLYPNGEWGITDYEENP